MILEATSRDVTIFNSFPLSFPVSEQSSRHDTAPPPLLQFNRKFKPKQERTSISIDVAVLSSTSSMASSLHDHPIPPTTSPPRAALDTKVDLREEVEMKQAKPVTRLMRVRLYMYIHLGAVLARASEAPSNCISYILTAAGKCMCVHSQRGVG